MARLEAGEDVVEIIVGAAARQPRGRGARDAVAAGIVAHQRAVGVVVVYLLHVAMGVGHYAVVAYIVHL